MTKRHLRDKSKKRRKSQTVKDPHFTRIGRTINNIAGNVRAIIAGRDVGIENSAIAIGEGAKATRITNIIFHLRQKWVLVFLLLLLLGLNSYYYGPSFYHWYVYKATDEEILVLLADFTDESDNVTYDAAGRIEETLRTAFTQYDLPNVRLVRVNQAFKRTELESVKTLGTRYNATLFIWGYYDDAGMYPRFTVIKEHRVYTLPEDPQDKLANLASPPDDIVGYINFELPAQMTYFTQFTIGQIFYFDHSYVEALDLFKSAESVISRNEKAQVEAIKNSLSALYYYEGAIQNINRDYEQAIQNFNKSIELVPGTVSAYRDRGYSYAKSGNLDQAIFDYTMAIALDSKDAWTYLNRGFVNSESNNEDLAKLDFTKVIKLDPEGAEGYNIRGFAYSELGYQEQAIHDHSKAIELAPDVAEYYTDRGDAYLRSDVEHLFDGNLEKAFRDYNQAIELDPNFANAYNERGVAYGLSGDHARSIQDFTNAIHIEPEYALAYFNRGFAYFLSGNLMQAIQDYTKSIELNPDHALV